MDKKLLRGLGAFIFLSGIGLAWVWFTWELALVLFIALLGSNIENKHGND